MISSESCDLLKFKLDASHTVCQAKLRSAAANMKAIIMGLYGEGKAHSMEKADGNRQSQWGRWC